MSDLSFRQADLSDLERIMVIMFQAKAQMAREGKHQWDENYPCTVHIEADIQRGVGYVLERGNAIIAYGAVVFTGEPAYGYIEGKWLTDTDDYVVLHRLAVADEAKRQGIAGLFCQEVIQLAKEREVHSFRVDTNYDNIYMQHLLARLEFSYCGEIFYEKGNRMAYEKII